MLLWLILHTTLSFHNLGASFLLVALCAGAPGMFGPCDIDHVHGDALACFDLSDGWRRAMEPHIDEAAVHAEADRSLCWGEPFLTCGIDQALLAGARPAYWSHWSSVKVQEQSGLVHETTNAAP